MNFEIFKTSTSDIQLTHEERTNEKSDSEADTGASGQTDLPSGALSCTCPPENHLSVQIQDHQRWAAQEHMEWIRYNLDPYYPFYGNEERDDAEDGARPGLQTEASEPEELSGEDSDTGSESDVDEEDDDDTVPPGILALLQMLRGDDDDDGAIDVDINNNFLENIMA